MTGSLQARPGRLTVIGLLLMVVVAPPASAAVSPASERPAVFRNGTWFLRPALSSGPSTSFGFGLPGDLPVTGDWDQDGDGIDTPGVFRNGVWYYRNSLGPGVVHSFGFGLAGDLPAVWSRSRCSPAYPGLCLPPPPPDLDCGDISARNFRVLRPDPHRLDGDGDGIGCET
jgi:Excalibur calcium-binding domain